MAYRQSPSQLQEGMDNIARYQGVGVHQIQPDSNEMTDPDSWYNKYKPSQIAMHGGDYRVNETALRGLMRANRQKDPGIGGSTNPVTAGEGLA